MEKPASVTLVAGARSALLLVILLAAERISVAVRSIEILQLLSRLLTLTTSYWRHLLSRH